MGMHLKDTAIDYVLKNGTHAIITQPDTGLCTLLCSFLCPCRAANHKLSLICNTGRKQKDEVSKKEGLVCEVVVADWGVWVPYVTPLLRAGSNWPVSVHWAH